MHSASSSKAQPIRMSKFPIKTAMDEKYVDQECAYIKTALIQIQQKCNSVQSFEDIYRRAYSMTINKHGHRVYNGLREVLEAHMKKVRQPVLKAPSGNVLPIVLETWKDHTVAMSMIRDVLMYLDKVYVARENVEPVYDLGLSCLRVHVICYKDVNERIRRGLLDMIQQERDGGLIDWLLLKQICSMLYDIGVYEQEFEKLFLCETAEHYKKRGIELISNNTSTVYVDQVEKFITDEAIRAQRSFKDETKKKVLETIENELIKAHMQTIVDMEGSGVTFLLEDHFLHCNKSPGEGRIVDLRKIYHLLTRVNGGHSILCKAVTEWIRQKGALIADPALQSDEIKSSPILYVNSLIELKKYADDMLTKAFRNDSSFKNKLYAEFEQFINKNPNSAESLAVFIDEKLKSGARVNTDVEMEQSISGVMELFRFLSNKDIFEHFYKRFLARRLLNERAVSDDAEKRMITRLRTECGYQYTQKLELMFKDRELWPTLQGAYREYLDGLARHRPTLDVQVRVLTCGVWPNSITMQCCLPDDVERAYSTFNDFYTKRHNGRKLVRNTYLGSADIKATFYNPVNTAFSEAESSTAEFPSYSSVAHVEVQKILTVTTHQMALLMLFNQENVYTYATLLEATKMPEAELIRVLQSLSMGKAAQRVLVRRAANKSKAAEFGKIASTDAFFVNDLFTSKLTRIKISMVSDSRKNQSNESRNVDREQVRQQTDEDRKHAVECAIVRVMKSRKRLAHNNLLSEVISQVSTRFCPTPLLIKQRIEALIERDYIIRDKNDERVYNYVS
ncbi:unnamed protein product, partial [Mesorhabditis belari]|uniref:Cullin family profile domain-containing protein n=1 Tax=Mesorhabditis belari TaxID=2138241 RepID=A0AAF3FE97_9BILA